MAKIHARKRNLKTANNSTTSRSISYEKKQRKGKEEKKEKVIFKFLSNLNPRHI